MRACEVRLHFAEIYWTETTKRVFNVEINGIKVLDNYDIVAKAGRQEHRYDRELPRLLRRDGADFHRLLHPGRQRQGERD